MTGSEAVGAFHPELQNRLLKLVNLKTLPVSTLLGDQNATGAATGGGGFALYKHGVEMEVQGSYLELLGYLSQLEKSPWRMFWSRVKMDVKEYPKVRLTLTLYTLSMDKTWLSI